MAAPLQLPRLHDGFLEDGARLSKRTKYSLDNKFNKQSTSFAALEEDEDVLRHGIKPFLKLKHPHTVYHADFNKYSEQYLLLDTTSVHFWTKTGQYIKSCKISTFFTNFISVPLNECLIAWSQDADCLKILSPDFKFLGSVECPSSVKSVIYNDSTDELLTGGMGNFTVWSFRKLKEQKLVRKSVIIVGIDPADELQQLMVEDVIGPAQRCFAVSSKRVYIFDIYGGKMLMCLDNLHKHEITSCIFVSNLTYLISSSMSGSIKVWDESWSLKHVFVGHCAKVTQLLYYVPDNCIISASVDKTIRLWSLVFLDLMQCVQTWSMTLGLGILPDNSTLYSFGDQGVEVWEITTLHKKLGNTCSEIKAMSSTTSPRVPTRLVVTLQDKSLAVLSPVTGEVLELCFLPTSPPPPSSPSLDSSHTGTFLTEIHPLSRPSMKDVVYIPSEGFIYCLDYTGDIYVFITSGNPCKLLTVWKSSGLDCVSSCLTNYEYLVDATPYSEADLDNLQVGIREDQSVKFLLVQAGGQVNQNILMAGCEDGSLVMFNRRYGRIDFRIQGHETSVAHIVSNTSHSRVVSAGNDHVIRIWRMYPFAEEALAPMFSYYTVTTPKNLITGLDRVFYSYEKPDTCTFITVMHDLIDKKNKYPHNPDDDHTGAITSISVIESQRIFVSASVDSTIKIWNHNNKLVRTLVLNTIPSAITFGNHEGDILLSIKNEIRKVDFKTYLPEEYLKHMIGIQYPIEVSERPVPKSRGAKEQMSDLESTLPSGIRQNRDQVGYVPLAELKDRAQAETIKKSEIAKLMQRNFELEQLSQGKYDIKKFIRKTKKMRDTAFEEYFKAVYPRQHGVTVDDDDECFENGEYVGPRNRADVGRRDSLVPTPVPAEKISLNVLELDLPSAPDGYKPNSCIRRAYRSPTPPPKSKKDKKKEWKLKKLTAAQMAELAAYLGNNEMLEGRDWATETESSSTLSSPDEVIQDGESSFSMTDESPTPPPPPPRPQSKVHSSRSKRSATKKTLVMQDEDDDEDDNFEPSDYMSKLQDIMAHVKPATPSPGPTPEPVSTPGSERPPSSRKMVGPSKPVKKFVSRPAPKKAETPPPPPPPDPLPEYIVLFQDEPWFRAYLPDPNPRTFPKASLTQFLQMILEALPKAAFHVKAEICQAIGLIHTQYGIPIPTDVKIALLQGLNEYPLPRVALPDEKQFILDALKLLQKLNVMDESVLAELLSQFIDGDDSIRQLVVALLTARGLMNQETYLQTELDSWETWKLEGDPRRKSKLIEMAEEWTREWKQRYNEFIANVGNEAKKSGKTVSEIMSMLSSPGTSPIVSIVNFFIYKCREKEEMLLKSGSEPKKTGEGVRNAVISMPAIKKSNLMRLGESHVSKCYPERESTLSRLLPQLDPRTQSRINILLNGFTTYVNLALKPININPFAKPENKAALKEKTRPKSLNLLSPFKYFIPELATLSITDNLN